jgi:outer membrane murein-binding lipoprotein Lpp
VVSIIGTGIAVITLVVGFMAILAGGINNRIDDLNTTVNTRINDVNARIDDLNTSVNARIDDLNTSVNGRIDEVETDLRELRTLVIEAIKADEPADD